LGTTIGYLFGGILADRYGASLILVGGGVLVVAVTILVILESSLFALDQSSLSREGLAE
jgi:predicted MFS family arabinose efflux permease